MKTTLNDIVNLQNETSVVNTINANNAVIETAFENTLSRDGSSPNQMEATLDMNSNHIINLPSPASTKEPVRWEDLTTTQYFPNFGTMAIQNGDAVNITGGTLGPNVVYTNNYVPPFASGVTRTKNAKESDIVDTRDFGIVDDATGLIDQRVALQAAIDQTPLYGTLVIQPTTYPIMVGPSGSGYCLRVDQRPIRIIGGGKQAWLGQLSTVANTDDFLRIVPLAGGIWENLEFSRLFIGNVNGTRRGKNGIIVDTTTDSTAALISATFEHIYVFDSILGHNLGTAFNHFNTSLANPNGGMWASTIRNCILLGGVSFQATGDQNAVERCQIAGAYASNGITMVNGINGASGNFGFIRNNVSTPGGTVIDSGTKITIQGNTFEQTAVSTEPNNAILDITGGTSQIDVINIIDNQVQTGVGLTTIPIRLANVKNATVDLNRITVPTAYSPIVITSAAVRPRITRRNWIDCATASPLNNSIATASTQGLQHEFYQSIRTVGDTTANILIDDVTVALSAGLSVNRVWTLPDATLMWPGQRMTILDAAQGLGASGIILTCTGTNTFQDGTTTYTMSTAGMKVVAEAYPSLNQWHVTKSVK